MGQGLKGGFICAKQGNGISFVVAALAGVTTLYGLSRNFKSTLFGAATGLIAGAVAGTLAGIFWFAHIFTTPTFHELAKGLANLLENLTQSSFWIP
jgi:hypothetical protein